jgi:hypothetical protein
MTIQRTEETNRRTSSRYKTSVRMVSHRKSTAAGLIEARAIGERLANE